MIKVITGSLSQFNQWGRKSPSRLSRERIGMSRPSGRGERTFTIWFTREIGVSWTLTRAYMGAPYYLIHLMRRRGPWKFDTLFLGFIHELKMPKQFLRTMHEVYVFLGLEEPEDEMEEQENILDGGEGGGDMGGGTQIFDVATITKGTTMKSKPIRRKWKEKKI